jgi:hypothetical protein
MCNVARYKPIIPGALMYTYKPEFLRCFTQWAYDDVCSEHTFGFFLDFY